MCRDVRGSSTQQAALARLCRGKHLVRDCFALENEIHPAGGPAAFLTAFSPADGWKAFLKTLLLNQRPFQAIHDDVHHLGNKTLKSFEIWDFMFHNTSSNWQK